MMPPPRGERGSPLLVPRTLYAPILAITMSALLFVYSRTAISAAKRNAQRHRESDGGQINWANENQRRHGARPRPGAGDKGTVGELYDEVRMQVKGERVREVDREGKSGRDR